MKNEIRDLIDKLNIYRDYYYNKNESLISDKEYDDLFDKLSRLEDSTGIIYSDSPTQTVGYEVQSEFKKVKHDHPMLSLGKTKSVEDLVKFCGDKQCVMSLKMDGLTCTLHYDESGDLVKAETRGNGEIGEDVLKNALCISNIPKHIDNNGIPYTIDGEVIITYDSFKQVNESMDNKYKHPRNLASGSLRQLDTKITKSRNLMFVAWKVISGDNSKYHSIRLDNAAKKGFTVVSFRIINPSLRLDKVADLKLQIEILKEYDAKIRSYPIDGMVVMYDDVAYGENLGMTGHHPKHSLAFKLYDDCYETTLRDIEWNTSRTGMIAPIAVFDPIDLDGAITSRATLHNISIMRELELGIGDTISVYRANAVIPKVDDNLTRSNTITIPDKCPCCGANAEIRNDGQAEFLYCTNNDCPSRVLAKFVHFCSKGSMDIDGLSEATLEKFINLGLLRTYSDIYHLSEHRDEIINLDGFGETSFNNLCTAIDKSRNTDMVKLLVAIGIDNIGKASATTLSTTFGGSFKAFIDALANNYGLTSLKDFGDTVAKSVYDWYNTEYNRGLLKDLEQELNIAVTESDITSNEFISGKTFVVTGAFNTMKRPDLEKFITTRGGKLSGSVSSKTDFLLTNETTRTTKYNKALELNIPIINEIEFFERVNS